MDLSRCVPDITLTESRATVTVRAPGRLHLGFLDPDGSLGRRFGSLGLVVDGFETEVEMGASAAEQLSASGLAEQAELERATLYLRALQRRSGLREPLHVRLHRVLPAHAGLGSGTQLALAIGRAFAQWHGLDVGTPELARWLGRGVRSGIGIAGFDQGGLLVDGGPSLDGTTATILSRVPVPQEWRILIVQDSAHQGLSGAAEQAAIATLLPLSRAQSADICHQVLMRVLPGAAGAEFAPFAAGINRIQQVLGRHFAPAQGGGPFTSAAVGCLIEWIAMSLCRVGLDAEGRARAASGAIDMDSPAAATGQSSWGPTGFAILPSQAQAEAVVAAARAAGVIGPSLSLHIVSARNAGAKVTDARLGSRMN
jgi:beta-RFAP synthase